MRLIKRLKNKVVACVLAIQFFSVSTRAVAQDVGGSNTPASYQIQYIPKGRPCVYAGENFRCFNLGETRLLFKFDFDYGNLLGQNKNYELLTTNQAKQLVDRQKQLELMADMHTILKADYDRLSEKWIKTDKELQDQKAKTDFWRSITFLGISGGLAVGVVGGVLLGKAIGK